MVTFGWRALLKLKHDPNQLVEATAIPALFTVPFTYPFGGALGGSPSHYLQILLPGTMVMSIVIVTMYEGARLANDVNTGVFDQFQSLGVWRGALFVGGLLSDAVRYLRAVLGSVTWSVVAVAVVTAVFAPLTLHLYSKRG